MSSQGTPKEAKGSKAKMGNNEKAEEVAQQGVVDKKRKRKEVFPFGNYRNYYGYRVGQDLEEDPRLKVLRKEWFEGKDCLDIGCNNGLLTICIAKKFCCHSILGVDIDFDRIEDANWNLRKILRKESASNRCSNASKLEVAESSNGLEPSVNASVDEETREISGDCSPCKERDLSRIVSFRKENFVLSWHPPLGKHYDTILCLSVTKWIHLNWGDDGVITLFTKIWRLLQPGGIFVLEPQPWRSYESNRLVSETAAINYRNIMFFPDHFQDLLLDKIGFRKVEDISSSLSGSKSGFSRPILAFQK
ncbi:hypothetical protein L1049_001574 [Liquidambar formosana]|uniref:RNA methyltransferase n=1 Tax=Liquidambar formosana TaxID=63359 RepID=A0AAP0ND12_LIQFO